MARVVACQCAQHFVRAGRVFDQQDRAFTTVELERFGASKGGAGGADAGKNRVVVDADAERQRCRGDRVVDVVEAGHRELRGKIFAADRECEA